MSASRPVAVLVFLISFGASTPSPASIFFRGEEQLNETSRATPARDIASVEGSRKIPYEAKGDGNWWVAYNLSSERTGDFRGYYLRLMIRNVSSSPKVASPEVELVDADGGIIDPSDPQVLLSLAQSLAATPIPPSTYVPPSQPSGGFWGGMAEGLRRGQSEGLVAGAAAKADEGRRMLIWVSSYWLKPTLNLPPNGLSSGALSFLTTPDHPLPLTVHVRIGESQFEFTTRGP